MIDRLLRLRRGSRGPTRRPFFRPLPLFPPRGFRAGPRPRSLRLWYGLCVHGFLEMRRAKMVMRRRVSPGNPHREQDQANCDEEANHGRQHYEVCYLADTSDLDHAPPSLHDPGTDEATHQGVGRTRGQAKPPCYDVPCNSTGENGEKQPGGDYLRVYSSLPDG